MAEKAKRPIAVWIAIVILSCLSVALTVALGVAYNRGSFSFFGFRSWQAYFFDIFTLFSTIISWVIVIVLIFLRKRWARWFMLFSIIGISYMVVSPLIKRTDTSLLMEPTFLISMTIGYCVAISPFVLVLLLLSFGKKTKMYFGGESVYEIEQSYSVPPPPPEF